MKAKFKFLVILLVGIAAGVSAIFYLHDHDPKYGFDMIADRIIPVGFPVLSIASALFCVINFKKGILISSSVFPIGVLLSMMVMSIYYSYRMSFELFALPIVIFVVLYILGIVGAFTGIKLVNLRANRS